MIPNPTMKLFGRARESRDDRDSEWVGVSPASASLEIGNAYHNGYWGPKDFKKAAKWYYIASELESAEALFNLGTMYRFGYGGKTMNKSVAAQYFHRAAEKGHIDAQYWIGYMYYTGEGLPKNRERAIEWLTKAAEKGDGPAREWLRAHATVDTTLPGVPHKRDIDR